MTNPLDQHPEVSIFADKAYVRLTDYTALLAREKAMREALDGIITAVKELDPFNDRGGVEFEGREIGSDERGDILLRRAIEKAIAGKDA